MLSISNKWDRGRAAFQMSHVCVLLWLMCSKPWNENEIHFNEVKVIYIQGHMLIWLINTKVKAIKPVNTAYFLCWYDLFLNMGWLILSCKNQLFFKEKKIHTACIVYSLQADKHQTFQCFLVPQSPKFPIHQLSPHLKFSKDEVKTQT